MKSYKKAGLILAVTLFLSNVLGFFRNVVLAKSVAPFEYLDAYFAAFKWPDLAFNILILGAISTVFVPIFLDIKSKKGEKEAYDYTNTLISTVFIVLVVALILLFFLLPILVNGLVTGSSPEIKALTLSLSRIMILSPLIFGLSYIVSSLLLANNRFFFYSIAPLVYNLAIIVGGLGYQTWGIYGLAWSVVIGAGLHLLIQLPDVFRLNYRFSFTPNFKSGFVTRTVILALPRTIGISTAQILLIIFTAIASTLGAKAIAIYNLTNDFATTPTVIVANALATVLFPRLSTSWATDNRLKFNSIVNKAVRLTIFLLIPSSAGMWVLRAQLTRLYLALGKSLLWGDTIRAINVLGIMSLGVVFAGLVAVLARVSYAQHDTKKPMYFAIISALISIVSAYFFSRLWRDTLWDVGSLGLALIIGQIINALLLYLDVRGEIVTRSAEREILFHSLPKVALATLFMALGIWWSLRLGDLLFDTHVVLGLLSQTALAVILGVAIFWVISRLLRTVELAWLFEKEASEIAIPAIDKEA